MRILAIETSCDETAIALVEAQGGLKSPHFKVLKNFVSSQIETHRSYGGVVPMLAKREHLKNLPIVFKKLTTNNQRPKIDLIAVTVGPGLDPCLWTGIEFAKKVAEDLKKPLIGANHLEGHLYSNWLPVRVSSKSEILNPKQIPNHKFKNPNIKFPAVALIVSGGHTILLHMTSLTKWRKLGETRDDASGEAFDKIARLLGLPYPGGPEIEMLSKKGNAQAINFPRPMLNQKNPVNPARAGHGASYDFSFSGLKTSVLYYLRDNPRANKADVAASFQEAVVEVLVKKTIRAAQEFGAKSVLLSGGVAANKALRNNLQLTTNNLRLKFFVPPFEYNTDNAAMIAAAAYIKHLQKKKLKLISQPSLNL